MLKDVNVQQYRFHLQSGNKKSYRSMGRAAIKYVQPHFVTKHSGEFYNTSKLYNPQFPGHIGNNKVLYRRPLTMVDIKGILKTFKKFVRKQLKKKMRHCW